jgi:hypothetical protein
MEIQGVKHDEGRKMGFKDEVVLHEVETNGKSQKWSF